MNNKLKSGIFFPFYSAKFISSLSDPIRPVVHTLNGNRGFFDMFGGKEGAEKTAKLLMEILTKMDDADSLRPLSLQIRDDSQVNTGL